MTLNSTSTSDALSAEVGASARLLVILGALLIGGILGSLLRIEDRLDGGAKWLHDRFAARSEGGRFVEGGRLGPGGSLPTNTDGGHLSNSYMQGWALNVEAVRQVRGECGERQVADCEVVQYVSATPCCRSIIYTRG